MKMFISIVFSLSIFLNSCAQQKFEKPQKPGKSRIDKIKDALPTYTFESKELKKNNDNLYCIKDSLKCKIINGNVLIINSENSSITSGRVYYVNTKGSISEGKYNGLWNYYDKDGKVIKKEKWDNGKLIYKKEYK